MKTLRQEIVEALNVAQGFAREQAAHYAIDGDEDTENICIRQMEAFGQLTTKVEYARCEECSTKDELLKEMAEAVEYSIEHELFKPHQRQALSHALQKYHEQEATNAK